MDSYFYANIIAANRAIFLPFDRPNVLTIFIAWLNLDFGFETCFYNGMNSYTKVWLQFAFPVYIMFLVAMVIFGASYSQRFAQLLLNKNPVATLATLIMLSYAKLNRIILAVMSFTTLENTDGKSGTLVWLVDANVGYFQGKHVPLFITALFVLLVGLVYAFFLFFWKWFVRCPNKKYLRWIRNVKLNAFMDAYHAPYHIQHRYWTGLLLLMRGVLYLVAAVNIVGDPKNTLLAIACICGSLFLLKELIKDRVYKNWFLNALESSFIFNLVVFAIATLYIKEAGGNQVALAYTSTSIAFLTFLVILLYHTQFTNFKPLQKLIEKHKESQLSKKLSAKHILVPVHC